MQYNAVIKLAKAIKNTDPINSIYDKIQSIEGNSLNEETNKYISVRGEARVLLSRNLKELTASLIGSDTPFDELQQQVEAMTKEALDKYNDTQEGWVDRSLTKRWTGDELRIVPQEILEVLGLAEYEGDVCTYDVKDRSLTPPLVATRFILGLIVTCQQREGMTIDRIEEGLKDVIKRNRRTFKRSQFFTCINKEDGIFKPNLEALGIEQEVIDAIDGDVICQKVDGGVTIRIGGKSFGFPDTFVDAASRLRTDLPKIIGSEIAQRISVMVERHGVIDYDKIAEECHIKLDVAKAKADELAESMGLIQKRFLLLDCTGKYTWNSIDLRVEVEGVEVDEKDGVKIVGEGLTFDEAKEIRDVLTDLHTTSNQRKTIGAKVAELEKDLGVLRAKLVEVTIANQEKQQARAEIKEKFNLNI